MMMRGPRKLEPIAPAASWSFLTSVMIRKPLNKFIQLRLTSSGGVGALLPQPYKPQINHQDQDNFQISRDVRAVLKGYVQQGSNRMESVSQYYFDGQGKALRPKLIMAMAEAVNHHLQVGNTSAIERRQYEIALISEMYHTASLYHDDVIDKAELRRGKDSANLLWGDKTSIFGGNYVIATSNIMLAKLRDPKVVALMSRTLHDLVVGELQQLSSKGGCDRNDRFNSYLRKTYNKTASLMANSCQAVAQIALATALQPNTEGNKNDVASAAFSYGKNLGIAFQLIDDYLDFSASATSLGKPAAADLKLGLATAPVLFAADQHEELESLIKRRFSQRGDVDRAFHLVLDSNGLEQTQFLANSYGKAALQSIKGWKESDAKQDLIQILYDAIERTK